MPWEQMSRDSAEKFIQAMKETGFENDYLVDTESKKVWREPTGYTSYYEDYYGGGSWAYRDDKGSFVNITPGNVVFHYLTSRDKSKLYSRFRELTGTNHALVTQLAE